MTYSRYIIAIFLMIANQYIHADWTSGSISTLLSENLCVDPNSSHPNLNSRLVSIKLPSSYDTNGGWVNGGVETSEGKALFLKWSLSPDQKKYRAMFTSYGSQQSLYIASEYGGIYSWIGGVPNILNTDNGFAINYQHQLSVPSNYIVNAKQLSREEFFENGLSSPYAGTDPAIGNGFFGAGFDNKLVRTTSANIPTSTSYSDCTSTSNTNSCILQNGAGISININGNTNPNKSVLQTFPEYNGNRIFEFQNSSNSYLLINYPNLSSNNFKLYGHYFFEINSGPLYNISNLDPQLIYKICPTSGSCSGAPEIYVSDRNYKADAYSSGNIYFKIIDSNNPNPQGTGSIQVQAYNSTSSYSDFIYNNVILQIQTKLSDSSRILYENAILNPTTKRTYQILMSLYIMLYGIYFLLGVVQVKVEDLVTRVLKIVVLTQLFTETSWEFFNTYFFQLFTGGMNQLIHAVTGLSSNSSNLFGFIDPFMGKLANDQFWAALFAEMISFHNGLFVIGFLSFFGVFSFLIGAFDIIVGYLLSVMGLSVMICMAPLFIVMILFQSTRSLFDNWVSVLFSNAIQPTITLLLFLVVEQMFETYISRSVLGACMGIYMPIKIYLDFSWINEGWNIAIPLTYFPGFPFLIPENNSNPYLLTSAIIAFTFGKVSMNLTDFSVQLASQLSSIMPTATGGKHQQASNLISSIRQDASGKGVG